MTWSEDETWEEEEEEEEEYLGRSPLNLEEEEEDEEYFSKPPLKRSKTFDINVNDKLSTLPDALLHHILSFFNMSEVIRTSEISRRWRSIWKTLPSLNFGFISARFIAKILLLRNKDAEIDKFFISCDRNEYSDGNLGDVRNWMNIAERRNLRELSLFFPSQYQRELLGFLFTSEKLQVLKLSGNNCQQLPISMCSAVHLKTIELDGIILPERNREKEVIISCLNLIELKIFNCDHHNVRILYISAPKLQTLVLGNQSSKYNGSCEICIFTPSISSLELKGKTYRSYAFGDLSSLVNATFYVSHKLVRSAILCQVLRGLYNVRNLRLVVQSLDSSEEDTDVWDQIPDLFPNLRFLDIRGFRNSFCVGVLRRLMINTASLENLLIEIDHLGLDKDWTELHECVSRLKSIEIYGVQGREIEFKFFEFVLGNAGVLEDFTWIADVRYYGKTKKDWAYFNTRLYSLPRASPIAQLLFLSSSL